MTVETRELTVKYRDRLALDRVDMEFGVGVTALVGENGAGKTTLLRCLAGLCSYSSGDVIVAGDSLHTRAGRRRSRHRIGYVPQRLRLPYSLTATEVVDYAAWLSKIPRGRRGAAVGRALEVTNLSARADSRVARLSGGMQRRVTLASAIVHDPSVLVLDEPTVGLDPRQRSTFLRFIADYGASKSVIYSTHIADDLFGAADSIIVLTDGSVAFRGSLDELESTGNGSNPNARIVNALSNLMRGAD